MTIYLLRSNNDILINNGNFLISVEEVLVSYKRSDDEQSSASPYLI